MDRPSDRSSQVSSWRMPPIGSMVVPLVIAVLVAGPPTRAAGQGRLTSIPLSLPDSGALPADLYGSGPDGVILIAHGGYSSRESWAGTARLLADSGFQVLVFETRAAIDLRRGSETDCLYDAPCMAQDVRAAIQHFRASGIARLTLVGGSAAGGAAAAAASDEDGGVDRLILLAPMAVEAPQRIQGRKLVVVGREDRGSGDRLRLPGILEEYGKAPGPKDLLILEQSAHGQRLLESPAGPALLQAILRFLRAP